MLSSITFDSWLFRINYCVLHYFSFLQDVHLFSRHLQCTDPYYGDKMQTEFLLSFKIISEYKNMENILSFNGVILLVSCLILLAKVVRCWMLYHRVFKMSVMFVSWLFLFQMEQKWYLLIPLIKHSRMCWG